MRLEFCKDMIPLDAHLKDFLGIYASCQQKFAFLCGQKILLKAIVEYCGQFFQNPPPTTDSEKYADNVATSNSCDVYENNSSNYDSLFHIPSDADLRKHNGSLMISIFNDAKRTSLTPWSWPSRHVALEMANNFKTNGHFLDVNPNLCYVTPSQHPELLNCIVKSDKPNLATCLRSALALSLRVDGSVDKTQDHNVYVLVNVVHRDGSAETLFLGFVVPDKVQVLPNGNPLPYAKSLAYFNCVKEIVGQTIPWDEFLLH